ncbi:MAG: hypothetical protein ACLT8E_02230 [Akkermansia sp.]
MLRDRIRRTEYAISTDTTRYVLNGISLSFRNGKMTLVATDGRCLPWRKPPWIPGRTATGRHPAH